MILSDKGVLYILFYEIMINQSSTRLEMSLNIDYNIYDISPRLDCNIDWEDYR